jgi:hypothetical protein
MLYGLHKAIMVMTMERSCLRGSAHGDNRSKGDNGREKQAFHVKPRKHLGVDAACLRMTLMPDLDLTENE